MATVMIRTVGLGIYSNSMLAPLVSHLKLWFAVRVPLLIAILLTPMLAGGSSGPLNTVGLGQEPPSIKQRPPRIYDGVRIEKEIPFCLRESGPVKADLYRPNDDRVYPLVVMIHGGGWIAGDKSNLVDHAHLIAKQGFVVCSINYRLAPRHLYPAPLEDCREAMRWVREQASDWHADLDHVGVWGYSAGAQLAAMLAAKPDAMAPAIDCCVLGGMPCDLTAIPEASRLLAPVFGGTRREFPIVYQEASPILHLSKDFPPTLLFHGEEDQLVDFEFSQRFQAALQALTCPCEFYTVQGQGHLMTFVDADAQRAALKFFQEQLK